MSNFPSGPKGSRKDGKETKVYYNNFGEEVCSRKILYLPPSWSCTSLDSSVTYPYTDEIIGSGNS